MGNKIYTASIASVLDSADGFVQYLQDTYGENTYADVINPGLDVIRKMDPDDRVPIDMVLDYYDTINRKLDDPFTGMKVGEHVNGSKIGAFTFIRDGYYHFIDALKIYQRYLRVNTELIDVKIEETDEGITFEMHLNGKYTDMSFHQLEGGATFTVAFLKYINAPAPYKIHFDHSARSSDQRIYKKSLGVKPSFDQPCTAFFFKKEDCRAMVGLGTQSTNIISRIGRLESNLKRVDETENNTDKIRFVLRQLVYLGEPNKEQLASVFGVTSRTLHRYLTKDGTSFNEILVDIRQEAAVKYLEEGSFSCNEIAFLLGYKDNSQFFKSFKVWFGVSPFEYKKRLGVKVADVVV